LKTRLDLLIPINLDTLAVKKQKSQSSN